MNQPQPTIRALGEVVLRVRDIDASQQFYERILGLEVLRRVEQEAVFFRIGEGYGGHTTTLVLFNQTWPSNREGHQWEGLAHTHSPLHHFALTIDLNDFEPFLARMETLGIPCNTTVYPWVGWRSIQIQDPEGNCIELVAYDSTVLENEQIPGE